MGTVSVIKTIWNFKSFGAFKFGGWAGGGECGVEEGAREKENNLEEELAPHLKTLVMLQCYTFRQKD